jgi:hypothetical protein
MYILIFLKPIYDFEEYVQIVWRIWYQICMYYLHTIWGIWRVEGDERQWTDVGGQKTLDGETDG